MKRYLSILVLIVFVFGIFSTGLTALATPTISNTSPYEGSYLLAYNSLTDSTISQNTGTLPSSQQSSYSIGIKDVIEQDGKQLYALNYQDNANIDVATYKASLNSNKITTQALPIFSVGDTKGFLTNDISKQTVYTSNATAVYVGTYCVIFVEDEYKDIIDATKASVLAKEFDENIRDFMCEHFGNYLKNADNKIVILLQDLRDDYYYNGSGGYLGGYYSAGDYFPAVNGGNGNECSMLHIDIYPLLGSKTEPILSKAYNTVIHEFQHMICATDYPDNFPAQTGWNPQWLNEAFSLAAEHMKYGVLTTRINSVNASSTVKNGATLIYKDYTSNNNDISANYGLPYLFGQYLRTQTKAYANGGNMIFKAILQSNYNDYNAVLDGLTNASSTYQTMNFDTLQKNFRIAMLLKETSGEYGFSGESAFDSLNYPIYSGTGTDLKGGGAVIMQISSSFTPSAQGSDIKFVGITPYVEPTPTPTVEPTPTPTVEPTPTPTVEPTPTPTVEPTPTPTVEPTPTPTVAPTPNANDALTAALSKIPDTIGLSLAYNKLSTSENGYVITYSSVVKTGTSTYAGVTADGRNKLPDVSKGIVTITLTVTAGNGSDTASATKDVVLNTVIYGDLNGIDGLTSDDTTEFSKSAGGMITLTPEQKYLADVNGDGLVNSLDYVAFCNNILKFTPFAAAK